MLVNADINSTETEREDKDDNLLFSKCNVLNVAGRSSVIDLGSYQSG